MAKAELGKALTLQRRQAGGVVEIATTSPRRLGPSPCCSATPALKRGLRCATQRLTAVFLLLSACTTTQPALQPVYPADREPSWVINSGHWIASPQDFAACSEGVHAQIQMLETCMIARGYRLRRAGDRPRVVPSPNVWLVNIQDVRIPTLKGFAFATEADCTLWRPQPSHHLLRSCHPVVLLNLPSSLLSPPPGAEVVWRPKNKGGLFATQAGCESVRSLLMSTSPPLQPCIRQWLLEEMPVS